MYHPFRHIGLKAISLALALLVWLAVSGEKIVERSLRVPLEMQNIPAALELVGTPPPTIDVRIRGGAGLLGHLAAGDVVAVLDLSVARPGRKLLPVTTDDVRSPVGVEVTQVNPSTIPLEFERSLTRAVRIVPNIEGDPAPGYAVDSIICVPQSAEVVGPETAVRQLTKVITEPISVAGASAPVREMVTLGVVGPGLRLKMPGKVTVAVDIRPMTFDMAVRGVSVKVRNLPPNRTARVVPAQVNITVKGTRTALQGLTPERFAAFVDLAGLGPGRYNLPIQVEPPPNVKIAGIEPALVAVQVR